MPRPPSATIRVKNLGGSLAGPHDAWGRPGRPQPYLVSIEVALTRPFSTSSSQDTVSSDTVHYGQLSKTVQRAITAMQSSSCESKFTLRSVANGIEEAVHASVDAGGMSLTDFRHLIITVKLPKASALGDGVSFTKSCHNQEHLGQDVSSVSSSDLRIHDLRVPTLIGVNGNERERKQIVVANIEIGDWNSKEDEYCSIEAVVTKVRKPPADNSSVLF